MVKLFVTETDQRVAVDGMQAIRGLGYGVGRGAPRPRNARPHDPSMHAEREAPPCIGPI
jgi:hypothetical protein